MMWKINKVRLKLFWVTHKNFFIIVIPCISILLFLYFNWLNHHSDYSIYAKIAGSLSLLLFIILGCIFVSSAIKEWSFIYNNQELLTKQPTKKSLITIFAGLILVDIAILLLTYFIQVLSGARVSFSEAIDIWTHLDSAHYIDIARDGYLSTGEWDRLVQLVFLPGYPLAIRLFNFIFDNYLYSALAVSSLCFAGAGTLLYRLVFLDYGKEIADKSIKYFILIPGSFFFVAPMSESMFLLLSLACFSYLRANKWFGAGLMGGLAAFTRSLGLVLLAPFLFNIITQSIKNKQQSKKHLLIGLVSILIIPLGFLVYCYINYKVSGDPFKFLYYQKEHWYQSLGLFFNTTAYQIEYFIGCYHAQDYTTMLGLWLPNISSVIVSQIILIFSGKKLKTDYLIYSIGYFVISIGATWLLSGPRYLAALFPLSIGYALISNNKLVDNIFTILLSIIFVFYLYMFVNGWQVW